jgi:MFS transporter, PHS family, inorganic phosphate transporter
LSLFPVHGSTTLSQIAFYGLGLNSGIILQTIGFGGPFSKTSKTLAVYQNLRAIAVGNLILSAAGLIPGYYASFFLIDSWGRKPIQLMGFTMLTILFIILGMVFFFVLSVFIYLMIFYSGFGFDRLTSTPANQKAFVFLYCLADFFQNFGPNVTTFVIPGEIFPTRYRSTANGISAASGKLGAIVAQAGFSFTQNIGGPNKFVKHM